MVYIYVTLIRAGIREFNTIPEILKEKVRLDLKEKGLEELIK